MNMGGKKSLSFLLLVCGICFTPIPCAFAAFSITAISPSTVSSPDDSITISASANGLSSSTQYVQVAITKEGEPADYFGYTKNTHDTWYTYQSSPQQSTFTSLFYNFTPENGSWNGDIQAKIDTQDSGFKGPGNYTVKLLRYITSSGYSSDNTATLSITIPLSTPTPTIVPTQKPTDTPKPPTPTHTPKPPTPTVTPKPTATPKPATPVPTKALEVSSAKLASAKGLISPLLTKTSEVATHGSTVLGTDSADFVVTPTTKPTDEVTEAPTRVLEAHDSSRAIFLSVGGLVLITCGILFSWIYRKKQQGKP